MEFLRNIGLSVGSSSRNANRGQPGPPEKEQKAAEFGGGVRADDLVEYGFAALQGRRANMEDSVCAQFKRVHDGSTYGFFGVFDGHGGPGAARFVQEHLFIALEKDANFPHNMEKALESAFQATDQAYLALDSSSRDDGCTGIAIVIRDRQMWVAHVGDSRAIMCAGKNNDAMALTDDHKPNRESERQRIESDSGVVIWAGTWRVGGVLAVSRAFGDRHLKRWIISLPDVLHHRFGSQEACVIMASDGLWDVISNEDALETVKNVRPRQAAQILADEALSRGTADNVSCIVIKIYGT